MDLARALKASDYGAYVVRHRSEQTEELTYHVRLGAYGDSVAANELARLLREQGGGFQIPQLPGLGSEDSAPLGPPIEVDRISLTADVGANEDTATHVEVVFVYEPKVLGQLMKMSAREYFSQKEQLLNDFPNMFISSRWEIPPGRSVIGEKVDLDGSAIGAIVFADYVTTGDHRIRIGASKRFHIKLGRQGVFPDGLAFQFDGNKESRSLEADLRVHLDDSSKFLTVFLSVPVYAPGMSRSDIEFPRFSSISSETVVDENTGEGDVDVPRLQPNIGLYVGEKLPSQYVGFPIAKVGYESNAYVLRPFEAPSLLLSREGEIFRRIFNLAQRARQKLSFLTERLNSKSQRGLMSSETEDAVCLLSSGLVTLETLLQASHIIPFNLYTWLSSFAGQSSALQTGQVPPNFPAYNHRDALESFNAVADFIEEMLDRIQEGYAVVPFEIEGREFNLNLEKDWIGHRLILGVKAPAGLALEDLSNWTLQAVIASQEVVASVRDRRVRGAKRRLIEGDSALKLMPAKGMVLAEVTV
ncbi:hypothetical protein AWC38_SpisGene25331, partial [Stylophora pistillata]